MGVSLRWVCAWPDSSLLSRPASCCSHCAPYALCSSCECRCLAAVLRCLARHEPGAPSNQLLQVQCALHIVRLSLPWVCAALAGRCAGNPAAGDGVRLGKLSGQC